MSSQLSTKRYSFQQLDLGQKRSQLQALSDFVWDVEARLAEVKAARAALMSSLQADLLRQRGERPVTLQLKSHRDQGRRDAQVSTLCRLHVPTSRGLQMKTYDPSDRILYVHLVSRGHEDDCGRPGSDSGWTRLPVGYANRSPRTCLRRRMP
jgi:hypothetical protein